MQKLKFPAVLQDSIDALQKAQLSLDAEQLQELTGHACGPGTALGEQLAANPMVVVTDGRYKYKVAMLLISFGTILHLGTRARCSQSPILCSIRLCLIRDGQSRRKISSKAAI